jgi:hypothetical protein
LRSARALDLDKAQAASRERLESVVLAESRNVDADSTGRLQDRGAGFCGDLPPVRFTLSSLCSICYQLESTETPGVMLDWR